MGFADSEGSELVHYPEPLCGKAQGLICGDEAVIGEEEVGEKCGRSVPPSLFYLTGLNGLAVKSCLVLFNLNVSVVQNAHEVQENTVLGCESLVLDLNGSCLCVQGLVCLHKLVYLAMLWCREAGSRVVYIQTEKSSVFLWTGE